MAKHPTAMAKVILRELLYLPSFGTSEKISPMSLELLMGLFGGTSSLLELGLMPTKSFVSN